MVKWTFWIDMTGKQSPSFATHAFHKSSELGDNGE